MDFPSSFRLPRHLQLATTVDIVRNDGGSTVHALNPVYQSVPRQAFCQSLRGGIDTLQIQDPMKPSKSRLSDQLVLGLGPTLTAC